jgi:uncharacterized membrane protein
MKAATFFTKEQQAQISASIKEAEKETSGEIRAHIETVCTEDPLDRAAWIFNKLGMHKTADRNGVLFYLAVRNHKFAVIGDRGINAVVPEGFWNSVVELLQNHFREGQFTEGLSQGIVMAGQLLKAHFKYHNNDVNELTDELSFDNPEDK